MTPDHWVFSIVLLQLNTDQASTCSQSTVDTLVNKHNLTLQSCCHTYLLKTFFSSLERDVLALCFRSLRLGYFFFPFPFPFLATRSEPRSSPVAASMSLMSSASRQSATQGRGLYVLYSFTLFLLHIYNVFTQDKNRNTIQLSFSQLVQQVNIYKTGS